MREKVAVIILCLSISFFLISFSDGAWQKELQVKGEIETGNWEFTLDPGATETTPSAGSDSVFESPSSFVSAPVLEPESLEKDTATTPEIKPESNTETEGESQLDPAFKTDRKQEQDIAPEAGLESDPKTKEETETTSHQDSKHDNEPAAEPERASETEPESDLISTPDS